MKRLNIYNSLAKIRLYAMLILVFCVLLPPNHGKDSVRGIDHIINLNLTLQNKPPTTWKILQCQPI